jgi:hypothetical protein
VGLAQLLEGGACLRSAKERFHVRVGQVEDSRAVALGVFIPGFARREKEDGRENDKILEGWRRTLRV